jgi:hypothetical protein
VRKTGIPERGFRSRGRAKDLKRARCRGRDRSGLRVRRLSFRAMVAAMAMFEGTPTGPADTARLVGKDLVPWLREYDGFRGVLVLTGEEKHKVITLWDTPHDEARSRPARLSMHESVSAAAGMSLVDYEVYELPVLDVLGAEVRT